MRNARKSYKLRLWIALTPEVKSHERFDEFKSAV